LTVPLPKVARPPSGPYGQNARGLFAPLAIPEEYMRLSTYFLPTLKENPSEVTPTPLLELIFAPPTRKKS
jgi:hypothetical protein